MEAAGGTGMATHEEVAAALAEARQLQAQWEGRLGTAVSLMASGAWTGAGATEFGQWLAGLSRAFKGDLAGLVADLQVQLSRTPGPGKPQAQPVTGVPGTPYP